jgi:hypothetical protein
MLVRVQHPAPPTNNMKLRQVYEMAVPVGTHPEYTDDQVKDAVEWLLDGGTSTPIEGSKFNIVQRDDTFGLQRESDKSVLGWVILGRKRKLFGQEVRPIANIQVLPQYRNTVAVLMLLNGIRALVKEPIYVDDVVFAGGQKLISAISRRPNIGSVYTIDKRTGEKRTYRDGDLTLADDTAILIERVDTPLSGMSILPGGSQSEVIYSFFEEFHQELLEQ